MTTQIKAYNQLIEAGENTYLEMQERSPDVVTLIKDAFEFHCQAVGVAKEAGSAFLGDYDSVAPDTWQIGICSGLVNFGLAAIKSYLLHEGLLPETETDADNLITVAQRLPNSVKAEIVSELNDMFIESFRGDDLLNSTTMSIASIATDFICTTTESNQAYADYNKEWIETQAPRWARREFEREMKKYKKVSKKLAKGFKNK
jgi:hypothetical protein